MTGEYHIMMKGYICERCKHTWVPVRQDVKPRVCPSCKSPYWETMKKIRAKIKTNPYTGDKLP